MKHHIFSHLCPSAETERLTTLLDNQNVRLERIVSLGQSSPAGFWYDQEQAEWVILLEGHAILQFEGEDDRVELLPGDYLNIPAHRRHRVQWTTPDRPSVWLALFYDDV